MTATRYRVTLLCLAFAIPGAAWADAALSRADALQAGKTLGEAGKGAISGAATSPDLDRVSGYQGAAPPETAYYDQGVGIEATAREVLPGHAVGHYVDDAATNRPWFNLDRDDPVVSYGDTIGADPEAVLGASLTGEYTDCSEVSREAAPATFDEARCTEWGVDRELTCQKTLNVTVSQTPSCSPGQHLARVTADPCPACLDYLAFDFACGTGNYRMHAFTILKSTGQAYMDLGTQVVPGGLNVYVPQTQGPSNLSGGFCYRTYYSQSCAGANCTIGAWFQNPCQGTSYYGTSTFRMPTTTSISDAWDNGCGTLETNGDCEKVSEVCAEPGGTRIINGVSVSRACWRYTATFRCATDETVEEPYCQELRDQGCVQVGSVCTEPVAGGRCRGYEQTYRCPREAATQETVLDCGGQVFCLGGDCFEAGYTPNADFGLAASHLGAIEAAARDFEPDRMRIFQGQDHKCKKTALGFKNCCKDSGWGLDLGLAQCTESEKILAEKRSAAQCHFVGSYKRGKWLGKSRYEFYCCFNSKLARILQEQGRAQLGVGWGDAEIPDCRGLTPDELTRIDFTGVDFSEFYADALRAAGSAGRPSQAQIGQTIQQRMQVLLPQ